MLGAKKRDSATNEPSWWQRGGGQRRTNPVHQSIRVKYAVREVRRGRRSVGPPAGGRTQLLRRIPFIPCFRMTSLPLTVRAGRSTTAKTWRRSGSESRTTPGGQPRQAAPTHNDVELISEILKGRGFTGYDRHAEAARAAEPGRPAHLHAGNALAGDAIAAASRGAGWHWLRQDHAGPRSGQGAKRGRADRPAQRIALLCYSIGLAQ